MNILHYSSLIDIIKNNKSTIAEINSQYTQLLSSLTKTEKLSNDFFLKKVEEISTMGEIIVCYFLDNRHKINLIGSGTIIYEPKISAEIGDRSECRDKPEASVIHYWRFWDAWESYKATFLSSTLE